MQSFADACLASPIGAALVAGIEHQQRRDRTRLVDDPSSDPELVARSASLVNAMSFAQLCEHAIQASFDVGPWTSGAEVHTWAAYRNVAERRPIAEAIAARFDAELHAAVALDGQEWWLSTHGASGAAPLFENHDNVYENGELSWRALRSYGPAGDEVVDSGFGEAPRPLTRWTMPVTKSARVFEIHRPDHWHQLCTRFPHVATRVHGTWALPGPNAARHAALLALTNQHAAAAVVDKHLCPKWSLIAGEFDAIHLSWAGFITAEGFVLTQDRITTMLRYWDRETTMWLADCFGHPLPMEASDSFDGVIDARSDPDRLAHDKQAIAEMLGRDI